MKILFLSYWGINEGLTSATVFPHLQILERDPATEKIIFCSIERDTTNAKPQSFGEKIVHVPLLSPAGSNVFATKLRDFYDFPKQLAALVTQHNIDYIFCRSSLAGALGYLVNKKTRVPYVVESFEPHADYMVESHVWKWYDPRLWIQRYFERKIQRSAAVLLPVSKNHGTKLLREGIKPNRVVVLPCCVSLEDFKFDASRRESTRKKIGIGDDALVGIYVGKFGGIYYDREAFELFARAFEFFGDRFYMIILTADPQDRLKEFLLQLKIPATRVLITKADHRDVPGYLSAADVAFSTIKPAPSRIFCSPIKDGEYWANGLPILLEKDIGDDSNIIAEEGGGFILSMQSPEPAFAQLKNLLTQDRATIAKHIMRIAFKHRRMMLVEEAYQRVFAELSRKL